MGLIAWVRKVLDRGESRPETPADPFNPPPPVRSPDELEYQAERQRELLEKDRQRSESGEVDPDRFEP